MLPRGYYPHPSDQQSGRQSACEVELAIFAELVAERAPVLAQHVRGVVGRLESAVRPWFACIFVNTLGNASVLRLWDLLWLHGPKLLHKIGLALLLGQLQQQVLAATSDEEVKRACTAAPKARPRRPPAPPTSWAPNTNTF